jgi:hypothetical protein
VIEGDHQLRDTSPKSYPLIIAKGIAKGVAPVVASAVDGFSPFLHCAGRKLMHVG